MQHDANGAYRFVDAGSGRLLQCETHEGWSGCYNIHAGEPQPIDYEMANWFVATNPKAMLRHNLLVARSVQGGRLTLFNNKLSLRKSTARPEETTLATRAEFADALADAFGLQVDAADLDAVMVLIDGKALAGSPQP
jgi:N-hydroxyarylamine O-acetyltransferase